MHIRIKWDSLLNIRNARIMHQRGQIKGKTKFHKIVIDVLDRGGKLLLLKYCLCTLGKQVSLIRMRL